MELTVIDLTAHITNRISGAEEVDPNIGILTTIRDPSCIILQTISPKTDGGGERKTGRDHPGIGHPQGQRHHSRHRCSTGGNKAGFRKHLLLSNHPQPPFPPSLIN